MCVSVPSQYRHCGVWHSPWFKVPQREFTILQLLHLPHLPPQLLPPLSLPWFSVLPLGLSSRVPPVTCLNTRTSRSLQCLQASTALPCNPIQSELAPVGRACSDPSMLPLVATVLWLLLSTQALPVRCSAEPVGWGKKTQLCIWAGLLFSAIDKAVSL